MHAAFGAEPGGQRQPRGEAGLGPAQRPLGAPGSASHTSSFQVVDGVDSSEAVPPVEPAVVAGSW